jgi:hypothetical protein
MNRNTKLLAIATLIVFAVMLYAGLRLKGFRLHNDVSWMAGNNGVHFGRSGIAYTNKKPQPDAFLPDSLSIELAIKVPEQHPYMSSTVLSLWSDDSPESVRLFQWKNFLIVQKQVMRFFKDRIAEVDAAVEFGKKHVIVITSCRGGGTTLYVNGVQGRSSTAFSLCGDSGPLWRLAIGNSSNARYPWHGDLYSLSIYRGIFSADEVRARYRQWTATNTVPLSQGAIAVYPFDERSGAVVHDRTGLFGDLQIPNILRIPQKEVLTVPWKDFKWNISYLSDAVINLSGFIPFGFFLYALLRSMGGFAGRHRFMITVLTGSGISLIFELVQVFMPTRASQMSDLIMNTLGTLAGIMICRWVMLRSIHGDDPSWGTGKTR